MYGDNPGKPAGDELASMGEGAQPSGETMDEGMHQDSSQTYELPADICPGMKEGEEMVLKIVSVKDGKYTVAYAPEEGHEAEGKEDGTPWEEDFRKEMSASAPQEGAM